jgi:ComF family protein
MLSAAARSLLATFFPSDCRICNSPLYSLSRLPVCPECLSKINPVTDPACVLCGQLLFSSAFEFSDGLCGECRIAEPPFARALAYGGYEGGLRELIHLLKYERVRPAAKVLGRMLGEVIQELGAEFQSAIVVPVPLHPAKLRQRGFNQAEEIARAALKNLRSARLQLACDVLKRRRPTISQTGLSISQRRENVRGAFHVQLCEKLDGADVLLVDDVFTTGTTACECARVLRRAGAARVFVATAARVMKSEATFATPQAQPEATMAYAAHA